MVTRSTLFMNMCLMGIYAPIYLVSVEAKPTSFMSNSFDSNHFSKCIISDLGRVRALKWPERLVILTDIAKAVQFLHTGIIPGFFNNRLRTNNILIDEYRRAKLSDYGLSIIYDDEEFGVRLF